MEHLKADLSFCPGPILNQAEFPNTSNLVNATYLPKREVATVRLACEANKEAHNVVPHYYCGYLAFRPGTACHHLAGTVRRVAT